MKQRLLVVLVLLCAASGRSLAQTSAIAFVNVNVIPMDSERVLPRQAVIVRDGVITQIGDVRHVRKNVPA